MQRLSLQWVEACLAANAWGYILSAENTFFPPLQVVHRTLDPLAASVQNMGVDHAGFHILVAQQLLNGLDAIAALEEVGNKGMSKCVGMCGMLGQTGLSDRTVAVFWIIDS